MNRITIIIPTINRPTLNRTINSLLSQTDDDWQAIVAVDGVPEEEVLFISNIGSNKIKVHRHQKLGNGENGAALVRRNAMNLVETPWVGFVDDDDTLSPDYVQLVNKYICEFPDMDLFMFRMQYPEADNSYILPPMWASEIRGLNVGELGISMFMRSDIFRSIDWQPSDTEDYNLIQIILNKGHKTKLLSEVAYRIRW